MKSKLNKEQKKELDKEMKKIKKSLAQQDEFLDKHRRTTLKAMKLFPKMHTKAFSHMYFFEIFGEQLHRFNYKENQGLPRCYPIEKMYDGHITHLLPEIRRNINAIWKLQKEAEQSYGDIDWSVKKVYENGKTRVLHFVDHVTCSDDNQFMVLEEISLSTKKTHIRCVSHEKTMSSTKIYQEKLPLRFYKDRGWTCEYIEKYHMKKLGGSYGDVRDTGYVLSFERDKHWLTKRVKYRNEGRNIGFYSIQNQAVGLIQLTADELRSSR